MCEHRQDKILLVSNEFRYGAEGGRSWKVAKVGSKRTPSQPVFCSEVQGGKERSQKAFLPQIKKRLPKHEVRRSWCLQEFLAIGKSSNTARRLKDLFDKAGRVGRCLSQQLSYNSLLKRYSYDKVGALRVQVV